MHLHFQLLSEGTGASGRLDSQHLLRTNPVRSPLPDIPSLQDNIWLPRPSLVASARSHASRSVLLRHGHDICHLVCGLGLGRESREGARAASHEFAFLAGPSSTGMKLNTSNPSTREGYNVSGCGSRAWSWPATLFTHCTVTLLFPAVLAQSLLQVWTTCAHFNGLQFLNTSKLSMHSAFAHEPHIR